MKKLMVAIAAVASAFGLYAADLETGTSFEALETGAFDWTKDDAGQSNAPWWFTTETEVEGTVTEYAGDAYAGPRPDKFEGKDTQLKFLALETSKPLYRGATTLNTTSEVVTVDNAFGPQDIGTGFYVDQLVKFTAPSDSEATIDLAGGKIALWLQEVELEENVTATNLMVTAGFFTEGSVTVQTNYVATLAENKDAASLVGSWHRVTIKAIPATTDDIAGFIVYIDGVAVTTADAIAAAGVEPSYSTLGAKYEDLDQLFPSAVFSGDSALTIAAVGFQGSGAIDDVSLTTVVPSFAKDDLTFDLDWNPEEITAITAGDKELTDGELALGAIQLTLPPNTTSLEVIATPVEGYTASLVAGKDCTVDEDGKTFTFETSAEGSIVAARNFFEVDGKGYPTFAAALAAAEEGDTITLKADCTIAAEDIGEGIEVGKEITLDLAGNDLLLDEEAILFDVKAAFTVVNSGENDAKIGYEDATEANVFAIGSKDAFVTIGTEANQDHFVVVKGMLADDTAVALYQGKFDKDINTEEGVFMFVDGVPEEGYDVTSDDNYWIVKKAGGPEPNFVIKIVDGKSYETIDEALADAEDGDELQLLKSVTLDDTLVIDKAIKFEMDGNEIKLAADKAIGIDVKAAATIQNGDITSTRETYANNAYMILNEAVNATYKNLTVKAWNYKFGLTCDSPGDLADECENAPTVTVTCENVDIEGNGTLFYAQHTILNLDESCSAKKEALLPSGGYAAAVYSALNATVTIAGGAYEHDYALISGNLGGQIIVNDGEFKGDIKSYMKVGAHTELEELDGYKAKFVFNDGTYDGDIVFEDDSDEARELDFFKKDDEVTTLAAPAGYKWDEDGVLVKDVEPETYDITITAPENGTLETSVTNDVEVGTTVTVTATPDEGYELESITTNGQVLAGTTFEMPAEDVTVAATFKKQGGWDPQVDPNLPASDKGITGKLANASFKDLSTWAQKYDVEFKAGNMDEYKDAFLLDCDPDEVEDAKKDFKFASITQDAEGNWVVVINNEKVGGQHLYGNGIAIITRYSDVTCETQADDGNFFKAELEVYSVVTPE